MDSIKLGKFLSELRMEKKLTQEQLAEILHISNNKISRWETGSSIPEFETLVDLQEIYDVTLFEFANGERLPYESLKEKTKKKFKTMKDVHRWILWKKILLVLFILLGIFLGITAVYTLDNYDTVQIYTLKSLDENYKLIGNYIKAKDYDVFNVTSLGYVGKDDKLLDIKAYNLEFNVYKDSHQFFKYVPIRQGVGNKILVNLLDEINTTSFYKEFSCCEIDENDDLTFQIKYLDKSDRANMLKFSFKLIKKFQNNL